VKISTSIAGRKDATADSVFETLASTLLLMV